MIINMRYSLELKVSCFNVALYEVALGSIAAEVGELSGISDAPNTLPLGLSVRKFDQLCVLFPCIFVTRGSWCRIVGCSRGFPYVHV